MITYLCLLRNINVGTGRTVKMAKLQELLTALGHADVTTYIQSGNAIFRSPSPDAVDLSGEIEERIAKCFGFQVSVILRTRDELAALITANPFPGLGADPTKVHVTFLARAADPARVSQIDRSGNGADEYRVVGREVYLHCPNGYGRTKLNNAFWERRLTNVATTRNWNTVNKLSQMAGNS